MNTKTATSIEPNYTELLEFTRTIAEKLNLVLGLTAHEVAFLDALVYPDKLVQPASSSQRATKPSASTRRGEERRNL